MSLPCQNCAALRSKVGMNKERLIDFKKSVGDKIEEPANQQRLKALEQNFDNAREELESHLKQPHR